MPLIKNQLRLTSDFCEDDVLITHYANTSQELLQDQTGLQFAECDFTLTLPSLSPTILLDRRPVTEIKHVKYYDVDGVRRSLTDYQLDTGDMFATLILPTRPRTQIRPDCVEIEYVAGCDIPFQATQFILLMTSHWYEHREATDNLNLRDVPWACERLLEQLRAWEI
jgi:uncharacterized phiE125 gp8 family phage protein